MASENSHLAGASDVGQDHIIQEFCVKKADAEDDDAQAKVFHFMEGKDCCK